MNLQEVARPLVERDEREAVFDDLALVGRRRSELGRCQGATLLQCAAPDQRYVRDQFAAAAPPADLLVGEVELPARIRLGGLVGVVGVGRERRRLAAGPMVEGDVSEDLERLAGTC